MIKKCSIIFIIIIIIVCYNLKELEKIKAVVENGSHMAEDETLNFKTIPDPFGSFIWQIPKGTATVFKHDLFSSTISRLGMHRILFLPDIQLIQKPDIRPDTWLDNYIFCQISNKIYKTALTIIDFCKR
jgi:hypothetical protein